MSTTTRELPPGTSSGSSIASSSLIASTAARYLCESLLASREVATRELIAACCDALAEAIETAEGSRP